MTSAVAALAAVLDQSFEQMGAAWAGPDSFDRFAVNMIADVWDNSASSIFRVSAIRSRKRQEQMAAWSLERLTERGPDQQAWVVEQAALAGYPLEVVPENYGRRDFAGRVRTEMRSFTAPAVVDLLVDYDLSEAVVRKVRFERSSGRLNGVAVFTGLRRRYDTGGDDGYRIYDLRGEPGPPPVELSIDFEAVDKLNFDSDDVPGLVLEAGAGASVVIGDSGVVRADCGELFVSDPFWHLSAAGRDADLRTPPNPPRPTWPKAPRGAWLPASAQRASQLLYSVMLLLRGVGHSARIHTTPVTEFCRTFAGAGQDVLAAGSQRFGRAAAFDRLIAQWREAGGDLLAPWFEEVLGSTEAFAEPHLEPVPVSRDSSLLLVQYEKNPPHHYFSILQAGSPSPSGLQIRGRQLDNPQRCAFSLEDFDGPGRWRPELLGGDAA